MTHERRFNARTLAVFRAGPVSSLSVRAAVAGKPAEIMLYDEIGSFGVTATMFTNALRQAGGAPVTLRINSPGGEVFDGLAIYNAIRNYSAPVETVVDGLAASAASIVALAAPKVTMQSASFMMIHNAQTFAIGDKTEMTSIAGTLAKIDGQLVSIYADKTGKPAEDIAAMMDAETWMTSADAHAGGFVDSVLEPAEQQDDPEPDFDDSARKKINAARVRLASLA